MTTTQTKHTSTLPLSIDGQRWIIDGDGETLFQIIGDGQDHAAHMVHATNHYPRLLAALKRITDAVTSTGKHHSAASVIAEARAAIVAALGQVVKP